MGTLRTCCAVRRFQAHYLYAVAIFNAGQAPRRNEMSKSIRPVAVERVRRMSGTSPPPGKETSGDHKHVSFDNPFCARMIQTRDQAKIAQGDSSQVRRGKFAGEKAWKT
jgi:hypothetical protein